MSKNNFTYKWGKLFAVKRYHSKDGVIKLTPEEQQELLDDSEKLMDKPKDDESRFQKRLGEEKKKST